jgi:hypothetical protein
MKKLYFILSVLALQLATLHADSTCCEETCCEGSNFVYLGPEIYGALLNIENTDSTIAGLIGLDNEDSDLSGAMYGVSLGYEYKHLPCQGNGLYANLDFNYGAGKLKKGGSLTRNIHEYDVTALLGYTFNSFCDLPHTITPYVGFGYVGQYHSLSSLHVKYRYHVYHVPVGIKWEFAFSACNARWTVGLNAAALPQVDSTVKISMLQGARWSLCKRTDWLVAIPVEYYCDCYPISLKLNMFWKRLALGGSKATSDASGPLGLPPQTWDALGASLDLVYRF